jgi:diguanylate cyclase (GGDEF)-like protein/putative nucleotidyltransferase with HDIG domain
MRLIIKKCFAYLSVSAVAAITYLLVFWGFHHFLHTWTGLAGFAILAVAFVMILLVYPLTRHVQKTVDKIYYGASYDYRQMVCNFAQSANNILDLRELAEAMLMPIVKATGAAQASLLLPSDGDFTLQYAKCLSEREQIVPLTLSKDSPIVNWFAFKNAPLSRGQINAAPEFKALCEVERSTIEAVGIELFFPMKSKRKLIGILALSKKRIGGFYSEDDIYMLKKLVDDAAAAIENAQLYAKAKESAHIDQLTGLLNHGYFHERVDAEISRCSRFADVFSVIFLDLDFFKAYNDAHGHLAGDDILRQIAQCIRRSIRGMDAAFRYGGDEFAVILPQAPLDDAYKVAERILKSVEGEMDSKGAALTCSMGLASWPTDGVVREDLLGAADAALYHSKQSGRNRISVAPELVVTQTSKIGLGEEPESAVLSTIRALAATVDAKDHSTYGHSTKTSKYATEIAEALGYSENAIARIQAAALLHDIGKIRVSDALLVKRGPLGEKDWRPIHEHPKLGVMILKHVKGLSRCLAAIEYHHEHYDGTGYPAGLKGEDIPLDARILAVADAYDAMTSPRPYREGKSTHDEAISELKQCAGTQFDPEIVSAFAALWEPVKPRKQREGETVRLY